METILIATDLSKMMNEVVSTGLNLAKKTGAKALLTTIINKNIDYFPPDAGMLFTDPWEARKHIAENVLRKIKEEHADINIDILVDIGMPQQDIIEAAIEQRVAMIVIGTHGRGALASMLMGGTAEFIVRHSPVPVLVIPFNKSRH